MHTHDSAMDGGPMIATLVVIGSPIIALAAMVGAIVFAVLHFCWPVKRRGR